MKRKKLFYGLILIIALLSLLEFKLVNLIHKDTGDLIVQSAYGVTVGKPHWREYQNRLLGPYLVKGLSGISGISYGFVHYYVSLGLHILKNELFFIFVFFLVQNLLVSFRYTGYYMLLFIVFQDLDWIYLWDYFDIIAFTLFLFGVLKKKRDFYFASVFLFAILNKESGLFISLWMILDSLVQKHGDGLLEISIRLRRPARLFIGAATLISGTLFVWFVRKALLVREIAFPINQEFADERPFHIGRNALLFCENLTSPLVYRGIFIDIFLIAIPILAMRILRKCDDVTLKLTITALMIYFSIWSFGLINELRVYIVLIPFFLFYGLYRFHLSKPVLRERAD